MGKGPGPRGSGPWRAAVDFWSSSTPRRVNSTVGVVTAAEFQPTRQFPEASYRQALESWTFIDLASKRPLFTSPFGDVFFQARDGLWWLDTLEGTLSRLWDAPEELRAALRTAEGQDKYLLAGLAYAAHSSGLVPEPDQIYDFTVPPVLGGKLDVSNISLRNFVVAVNLAGQLHSQVRTLPPGTRISGVTLSAE